MKRFFLYAILGMAFLMPVAVHAQGTVAFTSDLAPTFKMRGAYSASTTYAVNDVVSSGGLLYYALSAVTGQAPSSSSSYWAQWSGAQGPAGTNGTNGTNGAAGASAVLGSYAFASFPNTGLTAGQMVIQTDAVVGSSCTAGGGTVSRLCKYTGSTWVSADNFAAEKGAINGIAPLDSNGLIGVGVLPKAGLFKITDTAYPGVADYSGSSGQSSQNPAFWTSYSFTDANCPVGNAGYCFAHGFADNNVFNRSASTCVTLAKFGGGTFPGCAYAAFDARTSYQGSNNYNHFVSLQDGWEMNSTYTGTVDQHYGVSIVPKINGGTLNNYIALNVAAPSITGTGALVNAYGLYVAKLNGSGKNLAIQTGGDGSYFNGGIAGVGAISGVSVAPSEWILDEVSSGNTRLLVMGPNTTTRGNLQICSADSAAGTYYGCMNYDGTGLQLPSATAPTCSSTTAGKINYVAGATGAKDTVQVCAKDASNAYAWRSIY